MPSLDNITPRCSMVAISMEFTEQVVLVIINAATLVIVAATIALIISVVVLIAASTTAATIAMGVRVVFLIRGPAIIIGVVVDNLTEPMVVAEVADMVVVDLGI